jgi:two-component system, chemotaxis family, protein-glutamate methylesterase/glutaminase
VQLPEAARGSPPAVRVLIADDSSFMRKALTYILKSDAAIEVIDLAADGEEAFDKVLQWRPDVVLLDIQMPKVDGLSALKRIMAEAPTPVVVLSGLEHADRGIALKALELGAIDFISKPSGTTSYDINEISAEIIAKVRVAAGADVAKLARCFAKSNMPVSKNKSARGGKLVVIGASTGGPRAAQAVLSGLRQRSAAYLLVQHMSEDFVPVFAERLNLACQMPVSVAGKGEAITAGHILVAPGGHQVTVKASNGGRAVAYGRMETPKVSCPSIDIIMKSAAREYGSEAIGVLLTGVGDDGARGMEAIKQAGGHTIAQDESTSLIFGMPRAAIDLGCVDEVLPLHLIAAAISRAV